MLLIEDYTIKGIDDSGTKTYGKFKPLKPNLIVDLLTHRRINHSDHGYFIILKKYIKSHSMSTAEEENVIS